MGYLENIVTTTNAITLFSGGVNMQNYQIGGAGRPQEVYEMPQGAKSTWFGVPYLADV